MFILIIIFIVIVLIDRSLVLRICRSRDSTNKILFISTCIAVSLFIYLFLSSMVYSFNRFGVIALFKTVIQQCMKNGLSILIDNEIVEGVKLLCKACAVSLHFAYNCMITGTLVDMPKYSSDLLLYYLSMDGCGSFVFVFSGICMLVAPLSTAAWLISLLNTEFWTFIRLFIHRNKRI